MTDAVHHHQVPAPRKPRLVVLYGILVALLVISGLLLVYGEAVYGLLVLAIATLLNVRLLAFRRRLGRRGTEPDRQ
jgi:hypothetical protein